MQRLRKQRQKREKGQNLPISKPNNLPQTKLKGGKEEVVSQGKGEVDQDLSLWKQAKSYFYEK